MAAAKGGFAAALAAQQVLHRGPMCRLCTAIRAMSDVDRRDVLAAIDDPTILATVITRALRASGVPVSNDGVRRHRLNQCASAHEFR